MRTRTAEARSRGDKVDGRPWLREYFVRGSANRIEQCHTGSFSASQRLRGERKVAMANILAELITQLNTGALRVVDLTQPLSPQTPLLPLPSQWPNTPAFRICSFPTMTIAVRPGTGTVLKRASIRERTLTRPSIG